MTENSSSDKENDIVMETVSAPTNIATIKYWGKADAKLNTAINDSVSVTMDQSDLRAVTTVAISKSFAKHRLWLNGVEEDNVFETNRRFRACLEQVRALATRFKDTDDENGGMCVHVSSYNTFPTAAGLASSAAGYAALVFALAQLFQVKEEWEGQLSAIARQGSGSACRSIYGGFVAWKHFGEEKSIAVPIAPHTHWPDLRVLICVVSGAQKETPSTIGMMTSVRTSPLLAHRAKEVVPSRMQAIEEAFLNKDFATFGKLTMMDSNQFHAICLDTYPPIFYLNETSHQIIQLIHKYNDWAGSIQAAYTFDAGPNAVIFTTQSHAHQVAKLLLTHFPTTPLTDNSKNNCFSEQIENYTLDPTLLPTNNNTTTNHKTNVQNIYYTKCGPGPQRLTSEHATLDPITGLNTYSP